jgi:hypothetical protein
MKKILITTLFTILLTANQEILEDLNITTEDTNITQIEDVNLSELTEDELIAEFMRTDENLKNLDKLEKTVDKLSNQLGIEE